MLDNEDRADYGRLAIETPARETNVAVVESAETATIDVLAYVAHFCDRMGLDPRETFARGIDSYEGDFEDGPRAERTLDPNAPLAESAS